LGKFVIFYDITGFQRGGFLQIISINRQFPESLILIDQNPLIWV